MKKLYFAAYGLSHDFDLNKIANHFKINKKFKWEDALILAGNQLDDIIVQTEEKYAYIYSFGSVVFINFTASEMASFIKFMEMNFSGSQKPFTLNFVDEYQIEFNPDAEFKVSNHITVIPKENQNYVNLTALIIARSVALERIEKSINKVVDEIEEVINFLETGRLNIKDENIAKMSSKILSFKYASISYIMLFDKPDITWENMHIDDFYYKLVELFELQDRYDLMRHKVETLLDITEVFSTLVHEKRGTRLEWMVIILIIFEIILTILERMHII